MGFDVLRRVRWRNVGRTAGAVALVAAVVAWPRLTPPAPRVPGSEATPLVEPAPTAQRRGSRKREVAPPKRRQVGRRRDGRERREPAAKTPSVELSPVQGNNSKVDPAPRPAAAETPRAVESPPPVDPAQTEFGFEAG